jgi:ABC-2 type transport system ATP-binding protein
VGSEGRASAAIRAEGIVKRFGKADALRGVDLTVARGTVVGLLGPNGAGKTTLVRVLTTLLRPDAGRAVVDGCDVVREPEEVRRRIGLAGQQAAVDEFLTGAENLEMVGRLDHLGGTAARRRAAELLERFGLTEAAGRVTRTYSGGMRRRLDLAASLVAAPSVLFLDEPTTGLDPRSRLGMWDAIRERVRGGTTLLLTTQYLEEADRLAEEIVVMDAGSVVARGTSDELKRRVGGERIDVQVRDAAALPAARAALAAAFGADPTMDEGTRRLMAPAPGGAAALAAAVRELDAAGVPIEDIALRRPTLDEVFLRLTGHAAEAETPAAGPRDPRGARGARRETA